MLYKTYMEQLNNTENHINYLFPPRSRKSFTNSVMNKKFLKNSEKDSFFFSSISVHEITQVTYQDPHPLGRW